MSVLEPPVASPMTTKDTNFVAWLARNACGVRNITLKVSGSPSVQLAHVLTALSTCSVVSKSVPDVVLNTGVHYVLD